MEKHVAQSRRWFDDAESFCCRSDPCGCSFDVSKKKTPTRDQATTDMALRSRSQSKKHFAGSESRLSV
jgi:hypothetical protein